MILASPRYAHGFAPRDFAPLYPELWQGCKLAVAACLGPSNVGKDWTGHNRPLDIVNAPAGGLVVLDQGNYAYKSNGTGYQGHLQLGGGGLTKVPMTFSIWYRLNAFVNDDGGEDVQLMGLGNSSDDGHYFFIALYHAGGRGQCIRCLTNQTGVGNFHVEGAYTHDIDRWHHVCYVFINPGFHTMYIDGKIVGLSGIGGSGTEVPQGINTYGVGALLMSGATVYGPNAKVMLDDARFYDRALSHREAQLLSMRRGIAYEPRRIRLSTFGPPPEPPEPLLLSVIN